MFYVNFCSASKEFLEWLRKMLLKNARVKGCLKPGNKVLILEFAKKEGLKIIKGMYKNLNAPCLARKKDKIIRAFQEGEIKIPACFIAKIK